MTRIELLPLTGDIRVTAQGRLPLTERQSQRVWEIWEEELARRTSHLFDGTLLEFVDLLAPVFNRPTNCGSERPVEIIGRFINYREYIANTREPGLLGREIIPLSVSGLTWFGDHIGLGRRSANVRSYPGRLELFPSGSIEECFLSADGTIDYYGQLMKELREETGIAPDGVRSRRALALVFDRIERVYDICVEIITKLSTENFASDPANDEYSEFIFISRQQLPQFLKGHGDQLIPTSVAILEAFDYLPDDRFATSPTVAGKVA